MTRLALAALLCTACATSATSPAAPPAQTTAPIDTAEGLYARGTRAAREGDMIRAEQYMTLAVRAGYPRERAVAAIVEACLSSSRLRAALSHAEPHLRRHPDAWRLRLLVAAVQAALGRVDRAIDELERVTTQVPDAAEAHYLLAVWHAEHLGDEARARASFEHYLAHAPEGAHAPEARDWLRSRP